MTASKVCNKLHFIYEWTFKILGIWQLLSLQKLQTAYVKKFQAVIWRTMHAQNVKHKTAFEVEI